MYKLLLAEDEADVREALVHEIDWASCGFELIETAENGKEAAELIERTMPDVVVTDIKMPFMDGLALSEWIRERYPTTKIVILTGFDEFEYARRAVTLHIDEYLLKPFSSQELVRVLDVMKRNIDEETAQKENVQTLREHYRASLPVLREVFLASLLTRKLSPDEIRRRSENYGVVLNGSHYMAAVISIDNPQDEGDAAGADQSLRFSKDQELKLFAVRNIAEEIVDKHKLGIAALLNDQLALLIMTDERDQEAVLKKTLAVLEEIRQSVEKYLRFTVTIGVGTAGSDIAGVSYSYKDAVLALDYRLLLGNNRAIYIGDVETRFVEKLRFDELKEQALIRCLKVGTLQELRETVDQLFQGIAETPVSFTDFQIYMFEIVTAILKAAKDSGTALEPVVAEFKPLADIGQFTHTEEAKQWIFGICSRLMNHIASNRHHTYKQLVEQALAYTKEHYHETDITIQKVCQALHISPGYFSTLFKKETKMTFGQYLLQLRMEAAKELLRTTELKAFEIAEKVGYAEPNYFSFVFRKSCGMSPKEYRELASQGR